MTLPAVRSPSWGGSSVRTGLNSSRWGAQLLYYSHSDVESWSDSQNKSTSTLLCNWTISVCVFLFYEREWRCMHVSHHQSVYYHCASVHVWVPLPSDILPYVLTYLLTLHLTIEHTVFYLFMWLFPRKLSDCCAASAVSLNVRWFFLLGAVFHSTMAP